MDFRKIKGTADYFNEEVLKYRYIEQTSRTISRNFGFKEVVTPIFEATELFRRGVGDDTDIVNKEMYTFEDRGGTSLTLRPEGTAVITRCLVENKLYVTPGLIKLFYFGPMFRAERPQAGRMRQFTQFGVEVFGSEDGRADADTINLACTIFRSLGIGHVKASINSIGSSESRKAYVTALQDYFAPHIDLLCDDCKRRLNTNPLRILDCKIDGDKDVIQKAPRIKDFLSESDQAYFKTVISSLDDLGIAYEQNDRLVRGLDYYSHDVFELIYDNPDSKINGLALCGGGRYNGLAEELGGPSLPAFGFAFGVERLMMVMDELQLWPALEEDALACVITLGESTKQEGMRLANYLRSQNIKTEIDYSSHNLKPQFKLAERVKAKYLLIIGEDELQKGTIVVKDSLSGQQQTIRTEELNDLFQIKGVVSYAYKKQQ